MFHTFQATNIPTREAPSEWASAKGRRRISTAHACEECRRRKIRCDGNQPCGHCQWYKHPELCQYFKRQPRVVPSQKVLDELQASLEQSRAILNRLLPGTDIKDAATLSRDDLIDTILSQKVQQSLSSNDSPHTTSVKSEESTSLEALEKEPSQGANWDESRFESNGLPMIPDDVNALSMSIHRTSSYVGISSVSAALTVIWKIAPALEFLLTTTPNRISNQPTRCHSPTHGFCADTPALNTMTLSLPSSEGSMTLVDAYFANVHPFIPMVDEQQFRMTYLVNERRDPPWLALLNMVFAMGTIAASTCENNSHIIFYNKAKQYLDLNTFGSGHIEALQALGLMGGFYLHYESRPNMANAIMGAAIRMALALGLHREYSGTPAPATPSSSLSSQPIPAEIRRRTWWSLFCLDTWASTTLGRPSLGRSGSAVTVAYPYYTTSQSIEGSDNICTMILRHEILFCNIATKIQDRMAEQPLLPFDEISRFDDELISWHKGLPPLLQTNESCPERVRTPRAVMSWRYYNLRMLIHRPVLLNDALRSSLPNHPPLSPHLPPSPDDLKIVTRCRTIASDNISNIEALWSRSQISGWNGVWLLFQASTVPLVTLFAETNRGNEKEVRKAITQTERVVELLDSMGEWSIAAKKSKAFVERLLEGARWCGGGAQVTTAFELGKPKDMAVSAGPEIIAPISTSSSPPIPTSANPISNQNLIFPHPSLILQPPHPEPELSLPTTLPMQWQPSLSSETEVQNFFNQMMWGEVSYPDFLEVRFDGEMGDLPVGELGMAYSGFDGGGGGDEGFC
ncbi:MAG: hypothetical protein M1834_001264 [Cirrosporium novae-zelandiae]|nr:MAG: hypothetical protein M1834_001264 [Cirrosporium novae-zelandiae]